MDEPEAPMQWPKSELDQLTEPEYRDLVETNLLMHAGDMCGLMLKMKIIMRSLQVDGVLDQKMTVFGETMLNEFHTQVRSLAATPETMVNLDQIIGNLFAFTVKSGMTPGAVVQFEKRLAKETLN